MQTKSIIILSILLGILSSIMAIWFIDRKLKEKKEIIEVEQRKTLVIMSFFLSIPVWILYSSIMITTKNFQIGYIALISLGASGLLTMAFIHLEKNLLQKKYFTFARGLLGGNSAVFLFGLYKFFSNIHN